MLYTLYIDINLRVVKMLHTDNKQQITKLIQSPSKRRSYVTPGADIQKQHIPLNNWRNNFSCSVYGVNTANILEIDLMNNSSEIMVALSHLF